MVACHRDDLLAAIACLRHVARNTKPPPFAVARLIIDNLLGQWFYPLNCYAFSAQFCAIKTHSHQALDSPFKTTTLSAPLAV